MRRTKATLIRNVADDATAHNERHGPDRTRGTLPLLGKVHQHRWPDFQSPSQLDDVFEGDIALPTLNPTQIASCQTALQRQLLLRPALLLAQYGKALAKKKFWVG